MVFLKYTDFRIIIGILKYEPSLLQTRIPKLEIFLIHLKQSHLSILTKSPAGILYKKKDFNYSFKLDSKKTHEHRNVDLCS